MGFVYVDREGVLSVSAMQRVHPLFVCARPGKLIAEVERNIYFQLPVTYRTDLTTQVMLPIRRVGSD